jgi:hypothetical protein
LPKKPVENKLSREQVEKQWANMNTLIEEKKMNELKKIWQSNSAWQNICWLGNCFLFLLMIPSIIYRGYFGKEEN